MLGLGDLASPDSRNPYKDKWAVPSQVTRTRRVAGELHPIFGYAALNA